MILHMSVSMSVVSKMRRRDNVAHVQELQRLKTEERKAEDKTRK